MLGDRIKSKTTQEQDISEDTENIPLEIPSEMVDPSLVQIKASKAEIDRRITAFLRKKQLDVDIHNQREFCNLLHTENGQHCLVTTDHYFKLWLNLSLSLSLLLYMFY